MAEVLLFHHVHGRTPGILDFAERLRGAGHTVHAPDLFEGRVFDEIEDGMRFVDELGFDEVVARAERAAAGLAAELVYAGFSLGVVPAQKLAQTRPGARGALLFHACLPVDALGAPWPAGLPAQVHAMDTDPFFVEDGDLEAAKALVEEVESAELFLYPGAQHLFADPSLPSYDAEAAELLMRRTLDFLGPL